ncbi:MAG TPA: diaminopimelate decarboxylase [Chloroflexota bacterium]|jgi:diaminopimelate decarboxylase
MTRRFSACIGVDERGYLRIEDRDADELAEAFGTPLYVISEGQIRHNVRALTRAFRDRYARTDILFSNKANNNPAVRRIFNQEGAGGDCFGYGELYLSLMAGTDPGRLMLNGSYKQAPELTLAIESGVTINLDSLEETDTVAEVAERVGRPAKVNPRTRLMLSDLDGVDADWPRGIPVGPGARGHKFGMHYEDVLEVCRRARGSDWLELVGLHHHVGRWTNDLSLHAAVVREQVAWMAQLRDALGWTAAHLDIGGGLAWGRPEGHGPGGNDRVAPEYDAYAESIATTLRQELERYGLDAPLLLIEPGRALASNIGVLLTRVGTVKTWPGHKTWVNVDASQNHLPNILSANWYYHAVAAANADPDPAETSEVDLVGPLCTFDVMGAARCMPRLQRGDVVAFLDTGAYGETKAATFNAQPRPATVLVSGDRAEVITERETLRDVIGRYRVPARLLLN